MQGSGQPPAPALPVPLVPSERGALTPGPPSAARRARAGPGSAARGQQNLRNGPGLARGRAAGAPLRAGSFSSQTRPGATALGAVTVAHWHLVADVLSPVPPTFSLKTQDSGAGLTCGEKSACSSDHRESCPNTQLGPGVAPWSLSLGVFLLLSYSHLGVPQNSHQFTCLSSLGCQSWQKCCARPCFALSLPWGKPCSQGALPRWALVTPGLLRLSWLCSGLCSEHSSCPESPGAGVCAARGECHEEQGALCHSSNLW